MEQLELFEKDEEDNPNLSYAPWTDEQVYRLEVRQSIDYMHPYTCVCGGGDLTPTMNGWVCKFCDYTQDWCLKSDVES